MRDVLERILSRSAAPTECASLGEFWERRARAIAGTDGSIERAIAGAGEADRLGYAFASGYAAALGALVPALPPTARACLLATEDKGAHPKSIATTLIDDGSGLLRVDGKKRWATLGSHADTLLVVASRGEDESGKNRLALVRVAAASAGVSIREMPSTPFAPEIPHCEVTLENVVVAAADVLPGDGYERYLKPFRTIEDIHVLAALVTHALVVATTHRLPKGDREALVSLLFGASSLSREDASAATTHVGLAGLFQAARRTLAELAPRWAQIDAPTRERWERDLPLLMIADNARAMRSEAAWRTIER